MTGAPARALLSVRDLTIGISDSRAAKPIVEKVSFDLGPGEAVGLVGESGAGKSSIALALVGLLPPPLRVVGGSVCFEGRELLDPASPLPARDWRRIRGARIGLLFQEPASALDPLMTLGAQIGEVIHTHRPVSAKQARVETDAWFERVGLDPRLGRSHPHEVSGGQRQRAALAAALAGGPALLIADEPTTALDLETQRQVLDLLARLRRDLEVSLLLIGHDPAVLRYACTRTVALRGGIGASGSIGATPEIPA